MPLDPKEPMRRRVSYGERTFAGIGASLASIASPPTFNVDLAPNSRGNGGYRSGPFTPTRRGLATPFFIHPRPNFLEPISDTITVTTPPPRPEQLNPLPIADLFQAHLVLFCVVNQGCLSEPATSCRMVVRTSLGEYQLLPNITGMVEQIGRHTAAPSLVAAKRRGLGEEPKAEDAATAESKERYLRAVQYVGDKLDLPNDGRPRSFIAFLTVEGSNSIRIQAVNSPVIRKVGEKIDLDVTLEGVSSSGRPFFKSKKYGITFTAWDQYKIEEQGGT